MNYTPSARMPLWVAVPVCDASDPVGDCLRALAFQRDVSGHRVMLVVDHRADGVADMVRALVPDLPVPVVLHEADMVGEDAPGDCLRRIAMQDAALLAGPDGVLLTTDADCLVAPDWLAANVRHLRAGADAVLGRAVIDRSGDGPAVCGEPSPECAYAVLLDEILHLVDPDPVDPWPRHQDCCCASIAVRVQTFRNVCDRYAPIPIEGHRFREALRAVDARIRHAPDIWVTSADRARHQAEGAAGARPEEPGDIVLEPAQDALRRAQLRARAREVWYCGTENAVRDLERDLCVSDTALIRARYFGEAWARIEAESPVLAHHRVPAAELPAQIADARAMRDQLRATGTVTPFS